MKTLQVVLISVFSVLILAGAVFFFIGFLKPKPGSLLVDTSVLSSVYVNGSLVGKTPFRGSYNPGQITLKLVPDNGSGNLLPYETKITLIAGLQTVVRREFGSTEDDSSGDVISFDNNTGETSLVVISTPDNAEISLDGVSRGFAPYKTSTISPAQHQITVSAPNYSDRVMTVKVVNGLRLTVFAKLGRSVDQSAPQPTPTSTPTAKTYIQILETPTGFLRIRTEPGAAGEEIAEVKPGSKYLYLDTDGLTGWFKIQYEDPQPGLPNGITGWVSNQFSSKVDGGQTP